LDDDEDDDEDLPFLRNSRSSKGLAKMISRIQRIIDPKQRQLQPKWDNSNKTRKLNPRNLQSRLKSLHQRQMIVNVIQKTTANKPKPVARAASTDDEIESVDFSAHDIEYGIEELVSYADWATSNDDESLVQHHHQAMLKLPSSDLPPLRQNASSSPLPPLKALPIAPGK